MLAGLAGLVGHDQEPLADDLQHQAVVVVAVDRLVLAVVLVGLNSPWGGFASMDGRARRSLTFFRSFSRP